MESSDKSRSFLIIDTDAGVDDAQAIAIALGHRDAQVLAITTVQGNVSVEQVSKNVLRFLRLTNIKEPPPVYKGCENPLVAKVKNASYYHGEDGFGDIPDLTEADGRSVEKEHAVLALIRLAKEYPGQISLVCIGPLTNVAMAIRLCPDLGKLLKACYIMGGNYHGVGNVDGFSAEFNFSNDPEAAQIVLSDLKGDCYLCVTCWEICVDRSLTWEQYETWLPQSTTLGRFFREAEDGCIKYLREQNYEYLLCDQIAMAAALDPTTVTKVEKVVASVELAGVKTRGQMVVEWKSKGTPNVEIIRDFDLEKVISLFTSALISLNKGE